MADGSLIFDTRIDTRGIDIGTQKIKVQFQKVMDDVRRQTAAVEELEERVRRWQAVAAAQKASLGYVTEPTQKGLAAASAELDTARIKLEQLNIKAQETEAKLRAALDPAKPKAFAGAAKSVEKQITRIKTMLERVIIRAALLVAVSRGIQKIKEYFSSALKTNEEYVKSVGQLKAALMTLAQPILNTILPAFIKMAQVLTVIINRLASFFSTISGSSLQASRESAEALYEQQQALDGVGASAKKAGKVLASFDEINRLSDDSGANVLSSDTISPIFSDFDTQEYKNKINEIATYISGASLALGAILAFSGANIPLGIGLMAVGAATLASEITENWGAMDGKVKEAINKTLITLGASALVLGAIFAFSGVNIKLGIGLMALGAASLGTAAALNWNALDEELRNSIYKILITIGESLLVIGAVLAFSGVNIKLGIGLMAAGALTLASAAALNWEALRKDIKGAITKLLIDIGASVFVFGAILALSGANLPLGIGLMIAGGAALGTAVALNWDAVLDKLKAAWNNIRNWWNSSVAPKIASVVNWCKNKIINPMLAGVEGFINIFVKGINWLIERLNKIQISIPDWVPGIGGKSYGINIPHVSEIKIPRLATGAVIPPNREFLAVLGDQPRGTNIEAPLDMIVDAFRQAMREYGGQVIENIVTLDGEVIYHNQQKVARRHGVRLVGVQR